MQRIMDVVCRRIGMAHHVTIPDGIKTKLSDLFCRLSANLASIQIPAEMKRLVVDGDRLKRVVPKRRHAVGDEVMMVNVALRVLH